MWSLLFEVLKWRNTDFYPPVMPVSNVFLNGCVRVLSRTTN